MGGAAIGQGLHLEGLRNHHDIPPAIGAVTVRQQQSPLRWRQLARGQFLAGVGVDDDGDRRLADRRGRRWVDDWFGGSGAGASFGALPGTELVGAFEPAEGGWASGGRGVVGVGAALWTHRGWRRGRQRRHRRRNGLLNGLLRLLLVNACDFKGWTIERQVGQFLVRVEGIRLSRRERIWRSSSH